ncbi:MAG: hypothetical protein M1814_003818 [Vezdaea aestivalis]|nr:MAG: hypothetical protein M1814_003818 [Vezdaea aestivalis]
MKGKSLHDIVYRALFPRPRPQDPTSFSEHLTKNLVPEVRAETATFYGHLDCAEARYPGLNYSHPPHRMRLGRFTWHRRLFRAFDDLNLTKEEIAGLCRWEGTKWARERYEQEEKIKVIDTAGLEIPPWIEPVRPFPSRKHHETTSSSTQTHFPLSKSERSVEDRTAIAHLKITDSLEPPPPSSFSPTPHTAPYNESLAQAIEQASAESDGEDTPSIGEALNVRLRAAAEAREQGLLVRMDEQWEQWMKEVMENGSGSPSWSASSPRGRSSNTLPRVRALNEENGNILTPPSSISPNSGRAVVTTSTPTADAEAPISTAPAA